MMNKVVYILTIISQIYSSMRLMLQCRCEYMTRPPHTTLLGETIDTSTNFETGMTKMCVDKTANINYYVLTLFSYLIGIDGLLDGCLRFGLFFIWLRSWSITQKRFRAVRRQNHDISIGSCRRS